MVRRIARIRLDARSDQPWRRDGFRHPDRMIWVRANRARLVAACLTLCQAWASAGSPPAARSLGSFETWSQTLGGILHLAGVPVFLGNLDEVMEASDSEGGSWRAFIQLWWDRFGSAEAIRIEENLDRIGEVETAPSKTGFAFRVVPREIHNLHIGQRTTKPKPYFQPGWGGWA